MPTIRQNRVQQQLFEVLSELLQYDLSDPRLVMASITGVKIDRELKYATIYIHDMQGSEVKDDVIDGFKSASGFIRRQIGMKTQLPHIPELRFLWDDTPEQAQRIDDLLSSIDLPPAEENE